MAPWLRQVALGGLYWSIGTLGAVGFLAWLVGLTVPPIVWIPCVAVAVAACVILAVADNVTDPE